MSGVVAISVWSMAAASAAAALAVTIIKKYSVSIKNKYYCIGKMLISEFIIQLNSYPPAWYSILKPLFSTVSSETK